MGDKAVRRPGTPKSRKIDMSRAVRHYNNLPDWRTRASGSACGVVSNAGRSRGGVAPREEQPGGRKGDRDGGHLGGKAGKELAAVAAE